MNRREFIYTSLLISFPFLIDISGCKKKSDKVYQTNPIIDKLNLAIEHEYGAIVQYTHHAGITENKSFKKVIPQIVVQEVNHAILISNIIKKLGNIPALNIWPPQSGKNFKENLKKDILAEKNAIQLYEEILKLNLSNEDKKIISKIIKNEENHLKIFRKLNINYD